MDHHETLAAQLFLSHHDFVKGMALKFAPWPGLVEDITQQVFLEFMAKEQQWDLEKDVRPLLATMTRHVALRQWRERTRTQPEVVQKLAEHVRQLAAERDRAPCFEDEMQALRLCLGKLPEKSRELVRLYYFEDVATPEIGAMIDAKADTVCRALSRVREKLRECVQRTVGKEGLGCA